MLVIFSMFIFSYLFELFTDDFRELNYLDVFWIGSIPLFL